MVEQFLQILGMMDANCGAAFICDYLFNQTCPQGGVCLPCGRQTLLMLDVVMLHGVFKKVFYVWGRHKESRHN